MSRRKLHELNVRVGNSIAPTRFVLFVLLLAVTAFWWHLLRGSAWSDSVVTGFDLSAFVFIVSLWPLHNDHSAAQMRAHAAENDANRGWVLGITGLVSIAILAAISGELPAAHHGSVHAIVKLIGTLALAWTFTNLIFMLHYAHEFYNGPHDRDGGGFEFPGTPEPDYWDFLYFAFTAGMSFAASDVNVTCGRIRRIVVLHCLLSFVFNIGVLAFAINVLAGSAG